LYDADAGRLVEVRPAVHRLLRVRAVGGLRVLLVADLLRRAAERRGWRVALARDDADVAADLGTLNVHPASEALPGNAADVEIRSTRRDHEGLSRSEAGQSFTIMVVVEHAEVVTHELEPLRVGLAMPDPLALRLALLGVHHRRPAEVGGPVLQEAEATLRRWRARVAGWAEEPSRPMCAEYVQNVYAAYDDDLETPSALRELHGLEHDESIPAGSKFEAFVHLDRLLGLDLARDVGAAAPPR